MDTLWDSPSLASPFKSEGHNWPTDWGNLSAGLGDYHISQVYPHFGIHARQKYWFGDGVIHVHPGTSWHGWYGTEGLGAILDAFRFQIGVGWGDAPSERYPTGNFHLPSFSGNDFTRNAMTFRDTNGGERTMVGGNDGCNLVEHNSTGIMGQNTGAGRHPLKDFQNVPRGPEDQTSDRSTIAANDTHPPVAYYYSYRGQKNPEVYTLGVGSLWLWHNLGMIVPSFERKDSTAVPGEAAHTKPPKCMTDLLINMRALQNKTQTPCQSMHYYMKGFDGFRYPMPNGKLYDIGNPLVSGKPNQVPEWLQRIEKLDRKGMH